MASNPPIAGLATNGSFSLQTRIDRFLTTIEPHLQYFTNQGRAHLDSTLERDRAERRYLNRDKTGWASVPLGGTSLVDARGERGDISRGSEDSVNAMSSVSQRGGRLARMRDRNGNTAANAWIGDVAKKSRTVGKTPGQLITPVEIDSSSSPIQPWKDMQPKMSIAISTAQPSLPSPDRFQSLQPLAGIMNAPRATKPAHRAKEADQTLRKEPITTPAHGKSSRKRKQDANEDGPGGKRHNGVDKFQRQLQRGGSEDFQILPDTAGEQRSRARPVIPHSKRRKQEQETAILGEASSKLNYTILIAEKKKSGAKARKIVEGTTKHKVEKGAVPRLTADEKAREEILTARRTRQREKMSLKTATSKQGAKAHEADVESCSDLDDADQTAQKAWRVVQANKANTSSKKSTRNPRQDIGTALLRAYDSTAKIDRSHRITLPKTSLRLGIFSKGMSGRQGGTSREIKHPPDLQFQTESFIKRKDKQSMISSPDPSHTTDSDVSLASGCPIQEHVGTPVKKSKRQQQAYRNKSCNHKAASEVPQSERNSKQSGKQRRESSPEWPSILPSSDRSESVGIADRMDTGTSLEGSKVIERRFTASESGQKSGAKLCNDDNLISPHSRSASAPVVIEVPAITRMSQQPGRSPGSRLGPYLERESSQVQQPIAESHLSSRSPTLGDLSYDSILANALAEASCPSVLVQVPSSAFGSLLNAYIQYGSDQESAADYRGGTDADQVLGQEWQARDVEGYGSEYEQNLIIPEEFNQEKYDTAAEATYQVVAYDVPLPSALVNIDCQDYLCEGEIGGVESFDRDEELGEEAGPGGDEVLGMLDDLEQLDRFGHIRPIGQIAPSADYAIQTNNTLDVFGTDAELARKVLYGTSFHR
ncbi:hypothetical protein QFC22_001778 [Naganishia vaughanmartiniae]|uniref:Uncharacterized protein n=1 Tax=Naganishia vaughanmartiniae TaxID=1424756 RepID=A0ACC2XG46_9TREE|nr:hypothetical protein QFC22_001778 [Naganishia vaughanmartiniae]